MVLPDHHGRSGDHDHGGTAINGPNDHRANYLGSVHVYGDAIDVICADKLDGNRSLLLERVRAAIDAELGADAAGELHAGRGVQPDPFDAINAVVNALPGGAITADDLAIALYVARYGKRPRG